MPVLDRARQIVYATRAMPNHSGTCVVTIEPAPRSRRDAALQLLHIGQSRIGRLLAAEREGNLDMQGLFWARRGERLVGAAWGQLVPGRSAFCWPACLVAGEPEESAIHLQSSVDKYVNSAQVAFVQAVLPIRAVTDAARLVRAGYRHLADLDYLVCISDRFPRDKPTGELEYASFTAADAPRLAQLIERTYVGSLDCAELDGRRKMDDVLAGYQQSGRFRPQWWLVARHAGQDVGCILLTDYPEHDQAELIYMGIVPEHRGKGWGIQVTRYAQWLTRRAPRARLVLAVDNINWPAQGVYTAAGFDHWDRRRVYIRYVHEPKCGDGPAPGSTNTFSTT
jgi:mycothiol synthase